MPRRVRLNDAMTEQPISDPIRDAMNRRLEEYRTIDPKLALQGIRANRSITRTHSHSRRHRAFNR